ncbi:MAG: hypothetical protein WAK01_17235 [Methylocystis sp.]
MSSPIAVAAFLWIFLQPAGAQVAAGAPAPEIGAGFPGFLVAFAVACLAERRSRGRS